jgi:nitrate/nitrite-specific signal transduction histidine kinase
MSASPPGSTPAGSYREGPAGRLTPGVAAGLGAIGRVAAALVSASSFQQLAEQGLAEMRDALDMEVATLYLPDGRGRPLLHRQVTAAGGDCELQAACEVVFDEEAWRLAIAGGVPLVFNEEGSWLVANPFKPAASSWLVLPLHSDRSVAGVVLAASRRPIALEPTEAAILALIGDLLTAGITTAGLRQVLMQTELERERARLAALVHDGLAQDLALATREVALLRARPAPASAEASLERLNEAVISANTTVRERLKELAAPVPLGGVCEAMNEICDRFEGRGMGLRLRQDVPHIQVGPAAHAAVVRVLSEALTNVEKHASADLVNVELIVEDERLTLVISDDGAGFLLEQAEGPESGHLGLSLMHERAQQGGGTLFLTSQPGAGTVVRLQLPTK